MSGELTALLQALEGSDRLALDRAFAWGCWELKRLAHAQRVRASGGRLSTSALMRETYLKFACAHSVRREARAILVGRLDAGGAG